ncbi:hypothetical protein ACE6H2_017273 [Prunus campanulata]
MARTSSSKKNRKDEEDPNPEVTQRERLKALVTYLSEGEDEKIGGLDSLGSGKHASPRDDDDDDDDDDDESVEELARLVL